ncbi:MULTISPECIES: MlaD family protein [unclassified Nitratiruptor]|uniref:MlaD family protein n=1 Tax=unclassified Nitratiruptor TaxID=2624044 RepID=UPI0019155F69|nr:MULTISPECIES: MlaD family protein [unclassified Nitratiruptor]BCD60642.1 hypothetical protein NitYY0810_C1418 [Nitratiruptor sp. YY08-10]BCD64573.1 phospholipid/cholesterol/gamma-HCH transport system substrate-binding protein [Nitratiruptor sp. YY08-14]
MKTETKVGIFVAIGLLFLFLLSTQVNKFSHIGKKGYTVYAIVDNASGLENNSKVKEKGVDIGYVQSKALEGNRVKLKLYIYQNAKIPKDSSVALRQESMLGGKYLEIEPGNAKEYLKPGETIQKELPYASLDQTTTTINEAAGEFKAFIKELRRSIAGSSGEDLKKSIENLQQLTANLKELVQSNKENINKSIENIRIMGEKLALAGEKLGRMSDKFAFTADNINTKLPQIMDRIDDITKYLRSSSKELDKKLPTLMDKFAALENDLHEVVQNNKKPLSRAIRSADKFFTSGGNSFQKLDKYLSSIGKSQIGVNFRSYYMSDDNYMKSTFGIQYLPVPSKAYILEITSMDDYSKTDANRKFVPPSDHEDAKYLVSAEYAKRYGNFRYRLGLIESTGGLGADYYLFNDQGKVSVDLYDFNAVNDVRGDKAHLTITYRQRFLKHLDAYIGADNILNDEARNFFFGLGLQFIDQDMKYLLGTASGAGTYIK